MNSLDAPKTSETSPDSLRKPRAWLGWTLVILLAAGVALSFVLASDPAPPEKKGAGPRATPVGVTAVVRADIAERGRYPGELSADVSDIASFFPGRVDVIAVRVGDYVQAGAELARLDPVDLEEQLAQANAQVTAAEADQRRAQVELNLSRKQLERSVELHANKIISTRELESQRASADVQRAGLGSVVGRVAEAKARVALLAKRLTEATVKAPFAGRIAERYVDPGAIVAGGARLVRLVAEAPLRIRFDVPEHEIGALKLGAVLTVTTRGQHDGAAPDRAITATITGLAAEVSRDTRVALAEATIDAPPESWLPGMYAEANVTIRAYPQALVVPDSAVLSRLVAGGQVQTGVFVADADSARWVKVLVLAREGDKTAVAPTAPDPEPAGRTPPRLVEGAQVLTTGHVDLTDGAAIKVAQEPRPEPR